MEELLEEWVSINTHHLNLPGLETMRNRLIEAFEPLGGVVLEEELRPKTILDNRGKRTEVPLGKLLSIRKNRAAPTTVLLVGHMDTVFPITSPFQKCRKEVGRTIGPGIIDMKGGLAILLVALEALERSPYADKLNWRCSSIPTRRLAL